MNGEETLSRRVGRGVGDLEAIVDSHPVVIEFRMGK